MTRTRAKFFKSLDVRLSLVLFTLFIFPLFAIGSQMIRNQKRVLIRQEAEQLDGWSLKIADEIDVYVQELLRDARAIALIPALVDMEGDTEQIILNRLQADVYADYAKLAIVDLSGDVKITAPEGTLHNIKAIDSFHTAAAGVQDWVIDKALSGDNLILHMHTPIVDHNGQTIAVLGSPVVFDTLIAAISGDFSDIDSTHIYIFDRDGTALFSPTYDPLPLDTNLRERVSEVETRQDHVIKTPNEVQYIIGNAEIESLGWGVIIEQPLSDVLRPTLRVRNSAIVIILIISTVGLLGGFYFVNRLTQPLRELVPAAYALGEGHFDTPKPKAEAGTEVGILVEAFSNMRSAIRSRENALRQSEAILREERGQLALRVKERTHDLELANSELAEAVKSRDEFVSTMSHELRTPLNIILGLSEALARGVYQPIPVQQKKVVENIISSGETLLSMVENVLNLAKAQSGELVARREQVNLTELCGDIVNNYKVIGAKKSISLKYDETKCSDIFVQIDRIQVKQILKELLSNAVKFTDEGGQIGVEVRQDRVEKMVRIIVWDTGIGIEADALDLIFKPFQQLDTRLAREHGGTGLGLALAKQFALLNGGDISAESIPNHGSRFTLTLPVSSRSANRQKTKNGHIMVDEKHSTILLAEDNELGAQTFTDYLEFYGYLVIPARNGLEVLAFVEQEIPDLILMDVQMPKMDGLECMRRLRAQSSTATVPIIALTGMAMHKDEQQCLAAGANEYLSKPISLRLLQERIEVYLGGKNDKTLPKKHEFHE